MKRLLGLGAGVVTAGVMGLLFLPLLVASVVAGQMQQVSQQAAQWDIPSVVVPALQEAGQQAGIPWFVLAGVASVATDFARHAPDGVARGTAAGTAIFPVVQPPIVAGAAAGMFLVDPDATSPLADPQDVAEAASWLAGQLAALTQGSPLSQEPLSDPGARQYWEAVLAAAPLLIAAPAGATPIAQFATAVLTNIAAPITSSNLGAFAAWAGGENTCAQFNPLATTQPEPGATPFNTLTGGGHVWNYPSLAIGVQATTTALTNGRYRSVIAAFQADAGDAAVAAAVESSPWGTHHFGSPTYAGRQCGGSGSGTAGPTPTGPEAVAATIVARATLYQEIWDQMGQLAPDTSTTAPPTTAPPTTAPPTTAPPITVVA